MGEWTLVDEYSEQRLRLALKDPKTLEFFEKAILNNQKCSTCNFYKKKEEMCTVLGVLDHNDREDKAHPNSLCEMYTK